MEFQISTDVGITWETLESYVLNDRWNQHIIDLTAYKTFDDNRFRFALENDGGIPGDGFYFDDFEVTDYDPTALGNIDNELFSEVKVFPNPFDNRIIIDLSPQYLGDPTFI